MHSDEHGPERVRTEDLVLDIGDGVGALILYTGLELIGREVEVSTPGQDGSRTHTVVHERRVMGTMGTWSPSS